MRRTLACTLAGALIALAGAVGCAGGGGDAIGNAAIASTPLAGRIAGQPWSQGTAETDSFLSSSTAFDLSHYSDAFTPCSGSSSQENYLSLNVPRAPGDYVIDAQGNATAVFVIAGSPNLMVSAGHLVIDTVTSTTITGGINVAVDGDNSVDGRFTATICQ